MPKVSVIIPVYNVEDYIERCAISLFEQTLDDIQFIFVNDCTKDKSIEKILKIKKNYPHRENYIEIINLPENRKLHKARLAGIAAASGDYIIHCDPDDFVDKDMYNSLYKAAIDNQSDIVWCGYRKQNDTSEMMFWEKCDCDRISILKGLFSGKLMGSMCNKLVKREIAKDPTILAPKNYFCEDLVFASQYIMRAKSFSYVEHCYYHYIVRASSILSTYHQNLALLTEKNSMIQDNLILLHQVVANFSLEDELKTFMWRQKYNLKQAYLPLVLQESNVSHWINCFPEINKRIFFSREFSCYEKMMAFFILTHLYIPFRKFLRKD